MELNLEQLKKITFGAVKIDVNEKGEYRFFRFTEHQMEDVYFQYSADFYRKTKATAGIQLDFTTDAKAFDTDFSVYTGSSRKFGWTTVLLDGEKIDRFGTDTAEGKTQHYHLALDGREHRVTIFFPGLSQLRLSHIALDTEKAPKPVKKDCHCLIFGDSITQGYDAYDAINSYTNRLMWTLNGECINQAIGGEVFRDFIPDVIPFNPDFILVAYGTNDWSWRTSLSPAEEFFARLRSIYPDTKIFYIEPVWRNDWEKERPCGLTFEQMRTYYRRVAEIYGAIPFDSKNYVPEDPAFFSPDVLHPNDKGFECYAKALLKDIKPYI